MTKNKKIMNKNHFNYNTLEVIIKLSISNFSIKPIILVK